MDRRAKLDQCLELQLFNRDCEQAETWMAAREATLRDSVDGSEGVDALLRKHEDFDRAIANQEQKIATLTQYSDQLVNNDHYDQDGIEHRKDEVLDRYMVWYLLDLLSPKWLFAVLLGILMTMQFTYYVISVDEEYFVL